MTPLTQVDEANGSTIQDPIFDRPGWQTLGACRGVATSVFFAGQGESTAAAKAVCQSCVVRAECAEYALATGQRFGVWGGLSERERRRIRSQRRTESAA